MAFRASDEAQLMWQNIILLAYASSIAAIPLGDALLFSFTVKKPLAIGVARSIFVSALGASLAMVLTFVGWLIMECSFPSLQIDHFFYQLIARRIKANAFTQIIAIFVLVEATLLFLTIILGGFLASVTTFVGEQNQNHTRFSFETLLIDFPVGLSIVSFIQAIIWGSMCLISHLRGPVTPPPPSERRDRLLMMNPNASSIKANRRVTFKTQSEISTSDSKRRSDISQTSSTSPILQFKEDAGIRRIPSASSSRTTLLPVYLRSSSPQTNTSSIMPPCYQNPASTIKLNTPSCDSLVAPPPAVHKSRSPPAKMKPSTFNVPKILSHSTSFSKPAVAPPSRVPSAALSRYAWLKNNAGKDGPLNTALPYTRVSASKPVNHSTAYQRDAHRTSSGTSSEAESNRNSYTKRKSIPLNALVDPGLSSDPVRNESSQSYESDDTDEEWAETQSEFGDRSGIGTNAN
ncbi:hypothetical protein CROQUDRAFT_54740 [Cronartium quercuum f. sp. fusiforme G11]|uniref:Uncharacterized protein n=1 Tax=Cronartium quercuum f. sp. fusiforme G11 TaxID=708437 RepID=A0A9P6N5S8_9BASI|nr:hypothetical protein CROQUDRAFT_54740 [Cronartium quercuum f. sp. fusiforme G11]